VRRRKRRLQTKNKSPARRAGLFFTLSLPRPDQFVADVLPLDGYAALATYFDGFMVRQRPAGPKLA